MKTFQEVTNEEVIDSKIADLEDRILVLEDALEQLALLVDNNQDEEVCLRSEDGHQGTDEGRSPSRSRKGDWYWPSS